MSKPKGGERPIALMAFLYRVLARADRASLVVEWEAGRAGFWDKAIRGSSALAASVMRLVRGEIASAHGLTFCNLLWDMEKFYDSIDL
eukprot:7517284-Alexandrium_andersonii.AAC.1